MWAITNKQTKETVTKNFSIKILQAFEHDFRIVCPKIVNQD